MPVRVRQPFQLMQVTFLKWQNPNQGVVLRRKLQLKRLVVESDEDELAAYKLDSSPEQTSMETEVIAKKVATKKGPTSKEDDDEDFQMMEEEKGPKGKKAAVRKQANTKDKVATTNNRKRGGDQGKPVLNQKLITEVLNPADNIASPKKKVEKMRASPFNKKNSSVLGSDVNGDSSSSVDLEAEMSEEASLARNWPKRETRAKKFVYVESGSEEEEEDPVTEDSDFESGSEEEDDDLS